MKDATDTARTRARELSVDIEEVEGTGQDGRVTVPDVEASASSEVHGIEDAPPEEVSTPPEVVVLNPDTGLGGYAFDAEFEVMPGYRYTVSFEKYEEYRREKHNGLAIIVKA